MPAPSPRRSVRADLLHAAMELFAKGGSRGTPLSAIANRIGVTTPAITHHFGTKEALLLEIVDELDRAQTDTGGAWDEDIRAWAASVEADPAMANLSRLRVVIVTEALDPDFPAHDHFVDRTRGLREVVRAQLADAQRGGTVAAEVDVAAVAVEVISFLQGVQIQWLLAPEDFSLVDAVDAYLDRLSVHLTPSHRSAARASRRRTAPPRGDRRS